MHKFINFIGILIYIINSSSQKNLTDCDNSTCPVNNTTQFKNTSTLRTLLNKGSCSCNLQLKICDLNCCCDKDCTIEDRLIFDQCNDNAEIADKRFCKNLQISPTSEGSDFFENSLFCIMRNNLPPQYIVNEHQLVQSIKDLNKLKDGQYSWNINNKSNLPIEDKLDEKWKIGTKLWIVDGLGNITGLETPQSFMSKKCIFKKGAEYLVPTESQCCSSSNGIFFNNLKIYQNATLLNLPRVENINKTNFKQCPRNICIPFNIQVCSKNVCKKLQEQNIFNCTSQCNFSIHQVHFQITHNGSEGIKNCTLKIKMNDNVKREMIEFKVSYDWVNSTRNFSNQLSGNPGYINNYPILIANFIEIKNLTTNLTSLNIERKYDDFRKNFMVFPKNVKGKCLFDVDNYEMVEFGVNMLTKCCIKMNYFMGNNSNASNICQNMQRLIFHNWSFNVLNTNTTTIKKVFGYFGNASAMNEQDWKQFLYNVELENILSRVNGTKNNSIIICTNMTSLIQLEIFYSNGNLQQKIMNVGVTLEKTTTINFPIKNNTLIINIPIEASVMFYDITSKHNKKFIPPPSLEITLPYDFFYPFVKVKNEGALGRASIILFISQLTLLLCIK